MAVVPPYFFSRDFVFYTVPLTVTTAVPGVTVHSPFSQFCVYSAAGTVILPALVVNIPVSLL